MELMVVVVLVAVLAMLAAPVLRTTRNDRYCFNVARSFMSTIHRGKVRSGRGGAHLVTIVANAGVRGNIGLFEAFDTTPPAAGGPKMMSSCRTPAQWAGATVFVPGGASPPISPVIEGLSIDSTGDPATAAYSNVRAQIRLDGAIVPAAVICYTAGGTTYVGVGASLVDAVNAMQTSQPFSGVLEIRIRRLNPGGTPIGLTRRVVIAGGASPRIQSGAETEFP